MPPSTSFLDISELKSVNYLTGTSPARLVSCLSNIKPFQNELFEIRIATYDVVAQEGGQNQPDSHLMGIALSKVTSITSLYTTSLYKGAIIKLPIEARQGPDASRLEIQYSPSRKIPIRLFYIIKCNPNLRSAQPSLRLCKRLLISVELISRSKWSSPVKSNQLLFELLALRVQGVYQSL